MKDGYIILAMVKTSEKPKFNRDIHYSAEEMERYLGALMESHEKTLETIREGSFFTNKKIDDLSISLNKKIDDVSLSLNTKIDNVSFSLNNKIDDLTAMVNSHTEMIGTIMEDVSDIKDSLNKKVDYSDFRPLVKRVAKLEAKI